MERNQTVKGQRNRCQAPNPKSESEEAPRIKHKALYKALLVQSLILALVVTLICAPTVGSSSSDIFVDSGQNLGDTTSADVVLGDVDGDLDAFVAKRY
jgi:hypothetical protein